MIERIVFESQLVRVTEQHREIAQIIYDRRPYRYQDAYAHGRASRERGEAMTWSKAPAWYQLEMLELAHAVMQHPGFNPAAGPDEIEVHRLGDLKPQIVSAGRAPEWPKEVSDR